MPTGPPSASSKFRAPEPVGQWVHRARLTEMLDSDRKRRLALIHAPAGFGKSTLAAQWMEKLASRGVVTVWLSLDRDDNNTIWFVSHLLQAIRKARPGLDEELQQLLEERPAEVAPDAVVTLDRAGARSPGTPGVED